MIDGPCFGGKHSPGSRAEAGNYPAINYYFSGQELFLATSKGFYISVTLAGSVIKLTCPINDTERNRTERNICKSKSLLA